MQNPYWLVHTHLQWSGSIDIKMQSVSSFHYYFAKETAACLSGNSMICIRSNSRLRENTFRVLSLSLGNFPWYSFVPWSVLLRCSRSSKMMPQRCTDSNSIFADAIFPNCREGTGTEVPRKLRQAMNHVWLGSY